MSKITCFYCKKEITGNYISVDGANYHSEHFICNACGKPIRGEYRQENIENYHPRCHTRLFAEFCSSCGNEITGKYYQDKQNKYHPACYRQNVLKKCSICHTPLEGKVIVDQFGNQFHSKHQNELHKCHNCGRLICNSITKGGVLLADSRHSCNICFQKPLSIKNLNNMVSAVSGYLQSIGLKLNMEKISVKQVNLTELCNRHDKESFNENTKGFCQFEAKTMISNGKKISSQSQYSIYILNQIPEIDMAAVLAHEFMHVWIYENTEKEHQDGLIEGSCNYISYLFLKNINSPETKFLIKQLCENNDPVYGIGFKKVRSKFESKNLDRLLNYLKINTRI